MKIDQLKVHMGSVVSPLDSYMYVREYYDIFKLIYTLI
jgi:hypothetical protein